MSLTANPKPPNGGTTVGNGLYVYKNNAIATAYPNTAAGYQFYGWGKDGTIVSTSNPYGFIINEDTTLSAVFQFATYSSTSIALPPGTYYVAIVGGKGGDAHTHMFADGTIPILNTDAAGGRGATASFVIAINSTATATITIGNNGNYVSSPYDQNPEDWWYWDNGGHTIEARGTPGSSSTFVCNNVTVTAGGGTGGYATCNNNGNVPYSKATNGSNGTVSVSGIPEEDVTTTYDNTTPLCLIRPSPPLY